MMGNVISVHSAKRGSCSTAADRRHDDHHQVVDEIDQADRKENANAIGVVVDRATSNRRCVCRRKIPATSLLQMIVGAAAQVGGDAFADPGGDVQPRPIQQPRRQSRRRTVRPNRNRPSATLTASPSCRGINTLSTKRPRQDTAESTDAVADDGEQQSEHHHAGAAAWRTSASDTATTPAAAALGGAGGANAIVAGDHFAATGTNRRQRFGDRDICPARLQSWSSRLRNSRPSRCEPRCIANMPGDDSNRAIPTCRRHRFRQC